MMNNPGNLRPVGSSSGFQQFDTPEAGFDAMRNDLLTKVSGNSGAMKANFGEGYQPTLRNVISTYAPSSENNTDNYINVVAQGSGLNPDQPLTPDDVNKILPHMIKMESGPVAAKQYVQNTPQDAPIANAAPQTFNVKLPDGTLIQGIPIGTTKDQIRAKFEPHGFKFDATAQNGFIDNVKRDLTNRYQIGQQAARDYNTNKISTPEFLAKAIGKVTAGGINDVMGEAISSATPDVLKNAISQGAQSVADSIDNTKLGQMAGDAAKGGVNAYQDAAKKYPRLSDMIDSGADFGNVLVGLKGIGSAGEKMAEYAPNVISAINKAETASRTLPGTLGDTSSQARPFGGVVSGVKNEIQSLLPKTVQSAADLRNAASPLYDSFTKSGGVYSAKLTNEIADLAGAAKSTGVAGLQKPADEALNNALDYYSSLRGKKLNPLDLQKLDQSFSDDVSRFNRAGEYNFGRILNNLKYEMRGRAFDPENAANYVESGNPAAVNDLLKANGLWQQSYKAKDIEGILKKAQGTENPQTSIRTGIKNLLANDKKMAQYSAEDKVALQDAMKRGVAGGLVKLLGGRFTDAAAGGAAGFMAGGPVGMLAGAVTGKAVGGVMADAAGGIQANRLRGALQNIQKASPSVLPRPLSATQLSPGRLTDIIPKASTVSGQENLVEPKTINIVSKKPPNTAPSSTGKPMSMNTFIRNNGGLKDAGGDLASMGYKDLIRPNGKNIDDMGELLTEHGYFTQRPTVNEILDALGNSKGGKTLIRDADQSRLLKMQEKAAAIGRNDPSYVEHYAHSIGIETEGKDAKQLLKEIDAQFKNESDIPF